MSIRAFMEQPYFVVDKIVLPAVVGIVTTVAVVYSGRAIAAAKLGYRKSQIVKLEGNLRLAERLNTEPATATFWIVYRTPSSNICVAAIAFGTVVMFGSTTTGIGALLLPAGGSILVGLGLGMLIRAQHDAQFTARALFDYDGLVLSIKRKIERLSK